MAKVTTRFVTLVALMTLVAGVAQPLMALGQTSRPTNTPTSDQSTVIVKLKPGENAQLSNGQFAGSNSTALAQVNQTLAAHHSQGKRTLIPESKQQVQQRRAQLAIPLTADQGNLDDYFVITLPAGEKADDVAAQLKSLDAVATAYAKPLPAPAPATPDYTSQQTYVSAAPAGMGTNAAIGTTGKTYPGIRGANVQFADLEYSWNVNHEDLSLLRSSGALWANGTPSDPFGDTNHGTAVAGIVAADRNSYGVNGIDSSTNYHMVNTDSVERGWDVANALYVAANKMAAGDVILIEQQAWAPDNAGYAPIETYPDVYDAVSYATAKGIHVIEPAGNGKLNVNDAYDLSDPVFGGIFTTARADSGAVIVGAGAAGCNATPAHARMAFSNYGTRVNVQGYGECVTTTGYGNLYSASTNALYTAGFSGTSSASATIAAVAAEFSSSYEQTNGVAMTPKALRGGLSSGGTPQNTSVNPGKIGVLPNMASVLKKTDVTKPSAPTGLAGTSPSVRKIKLTWKASADNLGYVQYQVFRGTTKVATVSALTYTNTVAKSKTAYTYTVKAVDASGNVSAASNSVKVTSR